MKESPEHNKNNILSWKYLSSRGKIKSCFLCNNYFYIFYRTISCFCAKAALYIRTRNVSFFFFFFWSFKNLKAIHLLSSVLFYYFFFFSLKLFISYSFTFTNLLRLSGSIVLLGVKWKKKLISEKNEIYYKFPRRYLLEFGILRF